MDNKNYADCDIAIAMANNRFMLVDAGSFLTTVAWVLFFKPLFFELAEIIPGFLVGLLLTIDSVDLVPKTS